MVRVINFEMFERERTKYSICECQIASRAEKKEGNNRFGGRV